jgi:hypothetical protein
MPEKDNSCLDRGVAGARFNMTTKYPFIINRVCLKQVHRNHALGKLSLLL